MRLFVNDEQVYSIINDNVVSLHLLYFVYLAYVIYIKCKFAYIYDIIRIIYHK